MRRRFQQVDVFTDEPCLGNPVAVVLDGEVLDAGDMQRFAIPPGVHPRFGLDVTPALRFVRPPGGVPDR